MKLTSVVSLFLVQLCPYLEASEARNMSTLRVGKERKLGLCPLVYEYLSGGVCKSCPSGQYQNPTNEASCIWCPNGTVRGKADGTGMSGCIGISDPSFPCTEPKQYAKEGKCYDCPAGQVGADNKMTCGWCPNGSVRGTADGTGNGGCIGVNDSAFPCTQPKQYAKEGKCFNCPAGQVGADNKMTCGWCPNGTVRGKADGTGDSGCIGNNDPAFPCTEPKQYAKEGKCFDCPAGQVGVESKKTCGWCPNGTVRGKADGTGDSGCIGPDDAAFPCTDPEQYAKEGKCFDCPTGQVGVDNKTTCGWCPNGTVRGKADGTGEGGCIKAFVVASGPCPEPKQYAKEGKCFDCPTGQVGVFDKTTCGWCPNGLVRGNAEGTGDGGCVSAFNFCQEAKQYAKEGKCFNCPIGQVGVDLKKTCGWCPNGTVRGNAFGTGDGGCISALLHCTDPEQYAKEGKCFDCPAGQYGIENKKTCGWCPNGTVRGTADGTGEGGCIGISDPNFPCNQPKQYAKEGKCFNCPAGQVGADNKMTCGWCPNGTVRGKADGTGDGGCIGVNDSAFPCTGQKQYAKEGKCFDCPAGQVGSIDRTRCVLSPI